MNDYLVDLCRPNYGELRQNLWTKMDHICSIREQRDALDAEAGDDLSG